MENPLSDAIEDPPFDAAVQYDDLRSGDEMAKEYKNGTLAKGTVGWLERQETSELERITQERLHYKFNVETGREEALGPCVAGSQLACILPFSLALARAADRCDGMCRIKYSWVFVYKMGYKDDGPNIKFKPKQQWHSKDRIPLEVWQLVHRLKENHFHVKHTFSMMGDLVFIFIALPYKTLVETAKRMRIRMRLKTTKGTHGFQPEMAELYATGDRDNGSTFSSAHRQGLTLFRLKLYAHIDPELSFVHKNLNKEAALRKMKKKQSKNKSFRGMQIGQLMNMYGVRKHSSAAQHSTAQRSAAQRSTRVQLSFESHRILTALLRDHRLTVQVPTSCSAKLSNVWHMLWSWTRGWSSIPPKTSTYHLCKES